MIGGINKNTSGHGTTFIISCIQGVSISGQHIYIYKETNFLILTYVICETKSLAFSGKIMSLIYRNKQQ